MSSPSKTVSSKTGRRIMLAMLASELAASPVLAGQPEHRLGSGAEQKDFTLDVRHHQSFGYAWRSWQPNPHAHGSFFFDWKSEDEIAWRHNFRRWMQFVNEFKNRGDRVAVGEDSGFMYSLYGFSYVRELELLQEAGFHPLEAIRAATLNGAELLRIEQDIGTVAIGKKADLVLVQENPLDNLKVLYGTGSERYDFAAGKVVSSTGIRYTIKDGVVFDAKLMLQQVQDMVATEKRGAPVK